MSMKKLFSLIFVVFLCCCGLNKQPDTFTLNLVHTNDLHSHLLPFDNTHNCALDSDCLGGFARVMTFLQQNKNPNSLILDAGDRFTGTSFYTLTKSKTLLPLFKEMPYDAVTLGNHEFDDNLSETVSFFQKWPVPVVVANLKISPKEDLFPLVKPSVVLEKEGRKIGIIGILTPETIVLDNHAIFVTSVSDAVSKEIEILKKQGVNIIVVLSHIGLTADKQLAKDFPEIDIIVGGHSHSLLSNDSAVSSEGPYPVKIGKTLIVTSGMGGQFVGHLQAMFDLDGNIISHQGNTIPMNKKIPNNPYATKVIENAQKEIDSILNEPVAVLKESIDFTKGKNYCDKDCPIGKYITQTLHSAYPSADGVLLNSGSIRKGLPAGTILYQDLLDVFPFENDAVFVQLTGSKLKEFLEHGIAHYQPDTKTNALLQTSGIDYDFCPKDKKIKNILVKGQPLDLNKEYTILTASYLAAGGDNYPPKPYKETNANIRKILKQQMKKQ